MAITILYCDFLLRKNKNLLKLFEPYLIALNKRLLWKKPEKCFPKFLKTLGMKGDFVL